MSCFFKNVLLALLLIEPALMNGQVKEWFGATPDLHVSGKNLVDPEGNNVTLHGVMDTPNTYFDKYFWNGGYESDQDVSKCLAYFDLVCEAIANPDKGTYCNLFRLHLDPAWTNDNNVKADGFKITQLFNADGTPKKTSWGSLVYEYKDPHGNVVESEANICHFSRTRFEKYLQKLYIPIAKKAIAHGMYVIMRPPGVFPHYVKVGDYYNQYLLSIWDIVSKDPYIQAHAGQISFELGNEPVTVDGHLADFFQPIVNKIRNNGFTGIIWAPGATWQQDYTSYTTKRLNDPTQNLGFAVHFYPGWFGTTANDENQKNSNANVLQTFKSSVPVQANYPIVITEVDWSPYKSGAGHINEGGQQVTGNFGTWGTGSTNVKSRFGEQFKYVMDQCGNISWNLQGTHTYIDLAAYRDHGIAQPAFTDEMKAMGYKDASQACSGACFQWFYDYACGNQLPHGVVNKPEETTPTGEKFGNADFKNGQYVFYTTTYSAFIFSKFKGKDLRDCAELTIEISDNTIGYRLDVEILSPDGTSIVDGGYVIGNEKSGTRITDLDKAKSQTYDLQQLFSQYMKSYPGCKLGNIRLNTVVSSEDTDRSGLYHFSLSRMQLKTGQLVARKGAKGTSLEDIKMYSHQTTTNFTVNDNVESTTRPLNGWGNQSTRTIVAEGNNHCYALYNPSKTDYWAAQAIIEGNTSFKMGTEYSLTFRIKGSTSGSTRMAFHDGSQGCGDIEPFTFTTEWQMLSLKATIINNDADRLYVNFGDFAGTIYLDDIQISNEATEAKEITSQNLRLNETTTNEIFGAGLLGNVSYRDYADLTSYSTLVIEGSGDGLRILYNRPETGSCPEINRSFDNGKAVIDLTEYEHFHLNSIKPIWNGMVNVTSIYVISDGTTIDPADYYITGAGYESESAQAALTDESATVIDVTGYTGSLPKKFHSANPNCLLIYRDDDKIGFTWNERDRNLVKKDGNGYSAYLTTLVDGYDFRAPFAFPTVGGVTYTRDLGEKSWATMTLPFTLDVAAAGTPEVFTFAGVADKVVNVQRVAEGTLPAGTTILYRQQGGGKATLSGKNIAQTADGLNIQPVANAEGWFTAQSFISRVIDDVTTDPELRHYDVYAISEGAFVHATKKVTLNSFRSLFLHQRNGAAPACLRITIEGEEANSIETLTNPADADATSRYDVSGHRLGAAQPGLNIIRHTDGKVERVFIR